MTATRSRKQARFYDQERRQVGSACVFCDLTADSPQTIQVTKHFKVVQNIYPYSLWDGQRVEDHVVLIPNQHTDTLSDLNREAALEFVTILGSYESRGYNVYARAPGSNVKTVIHQHTHLIKLYRKHIRGLLFLRKPHIRLLLK